MTTTEQDHKCFSCGTTVDRFSAYCAACIEQQEREQGDAAAALAAFDAFHRYADAVARRTR